MPYSSPTAYSATQLLLLLTAAISQAHDFESALKHALQQICITGHWAFGEAWLPTPDGGHLTYSSVWYSGSPHLEGFASKSRQLMIEHGVGLPGRVWATQQPEWIPDISSADEAFFLRLDIARASGFKAGLGVPIVSEGQVLAVLIFLKLESCLQDEQQVCLVSAIATQLGALMRLKHTEANLADNQRRLNQLIDTLPGIVFTANPETRSMRYLSQGCYRLTGYTPEELSPPHPRTYNTITHPEDLPHVLAVIHEAIEHRTAYVVEYRIQTKLGTERWLWEKGSSILNTQDQVIYLEGFITDITDLKYSEKALRESEFRYRLLADNSHDLIACHSVEGILHYVSPACQLILGYAPGSLIGKSWYDFVHPHDLEKVQQAQDIVIHQSISHTVSYRALTQDGQYRWLETLSKAVQISEPTRCEIISVARDITDRQLTHKAFQEREAFLRLILDNIPQYIFWKNCDSVYLGCNRAFSEIVGLNSPDAIVGLTDYDLSVYSFEEATYFQQRDRLVIKHNQADLHVVEQQPFSHSESLWIDCSKIPIHDNEGAVVGVLGVFEDISERISSQQAVAKRETYLSTLVNVQREILTWGGEVTATQCYAVLEALGKVTKAGRVCIFKFHASETGELLTSQWMEWSDDDVLPTIDLQQFQNITIRGVFTDWVDLLAQGECVNQTCDEFTPSLYQLLVPPPSRIQSILLLPLMVGGALYGTIGFSNCQAAKRWQQVEIDLLQVAASALSLGFEQQQMAEALRQAETKYRSIFENAVEGIFQSTPNGQYLAVNPMMASLYGYDSPEDLIQHVLDIKHQLYVHTDRRDEFIQLMQMHGAVLAFESEVYRKDGSIIWISESARALYGANGEIIGFEGTVEDITQRKQTEAELHQRDRLLQGVADASHWLLTTPNLEVAIPQALAVLGTAAQADRVYIYENHPHIQTGELCMSMRFEWTAEAVQPRIQQPHWQNQPYSQYGFTQWLTLFQARKSVRGGVEQFPSVQQSLLQADHIDSLLMVPIFIDDDLWGHIGFDACEVSRQWSDSDESLLIAIAAGIGGAIKRQRTEEQMRYQAFHDALTGLPNRMLFNHQLPLAIAHAHRANEMLAVMFLDLDRFKTINDTLGHAVGDQLLQQVTQRLMSGLRSQDVMARWGGDEFTLILPDLKAPEDAAKVAQRLSQSLKPVFLLEGHELYVTSSVGIALYPQDGGDMKTLLQNADAAMYRAKEQGRNNYQFYTATINSQASQLLTLENSLHHALDRQEFRLCYQPQVNADTGHVSKVEALLRWQHPTMGTVAPQTFISLAEANGLIVPIGEWALKTACQQNKHWQRLGIPPLRVAVNLSARQLQQPDLVDRVAQILAETELEAQYLELEITETAAMHDLDTTITTLRTLRTMGVGISMDDFGTGYSSLSYLKRFPLNGLKIDRAFVSDLLDNPEDIAMLKAIVALAQGLHLAVVAEGVETREQVECLQALECHEMQGYWFSDPLPVNRMTEFLQGRCLRSQSSTT